MRSGKRRNGSFTPVIAYTVSGIIGGTAGLLVAVDAFHRDRKGRVFTL
jgi:hypothetical protein